MLLVQSRAASMHPKAFFFLGLQLGNKKKIRRGREKSDAFKMSSRQFLASPEHVCLLECLQGFSCYCMSFLFAIFIRRFTLKQCFAT